MTTESLALATFGFVPAGLRQLRRNRETGTLIGVYDGGPAGLDTEAGRWQTVCERHSTICSHDTLALAISHAAAPTGWCEACAGTDDIEASDWDPERCEDCGTTDDLRIDESGTQCTACFSRAYGRQTARRAVTTVTLCSDNGEGRLAP